MYVLLLFHQMGKRVGNSVCEFVCFCSMGTACVYTFDVSDSGFVSKRLGPDSTNFDFVSIHTLYLCSNETKKKDAISKVCKLLYGYFGVSASCDDDNVNTRRSRAFFSARR